MIIFAYTKEPLEGIYAEIVLGNTIQISIDCSMQGALKAQDEVCKLDWMQAMSYKDSGMIIQNMLTK